MRHLKMLLPVAAGIAVGMYISANTGSSALATITGLGVAALFGWAVRGL